jgi:putative SOS response-associated peptidase YedK
MCNLYRMTASRAEVAALFDAVAEDLGGNAPDEIYPGYPGLVVAEGRVRQMAWGFPYAATGAKGQKLKPRPVNNARADKLAGGFWRPSFLARRCLVPVSTFAEAEGERGRMTRTWFTVPGGRLFAVAGLWRDTAEWGPAYTMVMTAACQHMAGVHDRMPVILARDDWARWLGGSPEEAHGLCAPWPGALQVDRTDEPWAGRR